MQLTDTDRSGKLLSISGVRHRYTETSRWILDGIDLSVNYGQRLGIWGDNGSGKSTLVNIVLGLIVPKAGHVLLDGHKVRLRSHFQDLAYVGDPGLNDSELGLPLGVSVGNLLRTFDTLHAQRRSSPTAGRVRQLLRIDSVMDRWTNDLSTGERKRVMLAMALATQKRLLILDEPTEGLDDEVLDELLLNLRQYLTECNCSLILVSHRQAELAALTNELYKMEAGQLRLQAATQYHCTWEISPGQEAKVETLTIGALQWQLRQHMRNRSWSRLDLRLRRLDKGNH